MRNFKAYFLPPRTSKRGKPENGWIHVALRSRWQYSESIFIRMDSGPLISTAHPSAVALGIVVTKAFDTQSPPLKSGNEARLFISILPAPASAIKSRLRWFFVRLSEENTTHDASHGAPGHAD